MGSYTHLDLDERRKLYQLANAGRSPRQAAAELGRHRSTIYRELKRNHRFDEEPMFRGYFPVTAHSMAAGRRPRRGIYDTFRGRLPHERGSSRTRHGFITVRRRSVRQGR